MRWHRWAWLVVSAVLLYGLVAVGGSREVQLAFITADPYWLMVGGVFVTGWIACLTTVWRHVFSGLDVAVSWGHTFHLFLTTMFVRYIVPAGAVSGQPIMAIIIGKHTGTSYEKGLVATMAASFLNFLPFFTFGVVGAVYVLGRYAFESVLAYVIVAFAVMGLALSGLLYGLLYHRGRVADAVVHVSSWIREHVGGWSDTVDALLEPDHVRDWLEEFYAAVDVLAGNRHRLVAACVFAHLGELLFITVLWSSAMAIGVSLPFLVVLFTVSATRIIGSGMPIPGNIGGAELAVATILTVLSPVELSTAVSIALLYRFWTYWVVLFMGGVSSVLISAHIIRE